MHLLCCIMLQIACVAREHFSGHISGKPLANLTVSRQKINTLDVCYLFKIKALRYIKIHLTRVELLPISCKFVRNVWTAPSNDTIYSFSLSLYSCDACYTNSMKLQCVK